MDTMFRWIYIDLLSSGWPILSLIKALDRHTIECGKCGKRQLKFLRKYRVK